MAVGAEWNTEDDRAALLGELQHRVRNMLWLTRTIARRSAETSESLEDYVAHLDGRLGAGGKRLHHPIGHQVAPVVDAE